MASSSLPANINPPLTAAERAARSVFVGNIPYEATEEALKDIFAQVGPVVSFRLVYDRETGKPKGYGFCEYQDVETGHSAMRNLNNYDFGGRPLRVGVAAGEQNKDEMKGMQQAVGAQVIESPYGDSVEPEKVPEAISKAVASLPPEQMYELMKQMKLCIQNNPNEARNMLLQNPQLAYALLQAQIVMKIVDPQVALAMLYRQSEQIPPLLPDSTPAGAPAPAAAKPPDAPRQSPMTNPAASPAQGFNSPAQLKVPASAASSVPSLMSIPVGAPAPAGGPPGPPQMGGRPADYGPDGRGPPGASAMMVDDRMADGRMGGPPRGPPGGMYDRGAGGGDMGPGGPRHMGPGGPPMGRPDMHDPRGRPEQRDPRQMDMGMDPRARGGMDPRAGGIDPRAASRDVDHRVMDPRGGHRGPPGAVPPPPPHHQPPGGAGLMGQPPMHGGPPAGPRPGAPPPPPPVSASSAVAAATAASAVAGQDQEKVRLDSRTCGEDYLYREAHFFKTLNFIVGGRLGQAALIMQVLQLTDQQIAMLPPDQRQSILILKEQIARSGGAP